MNAPAAPAPSRVETLAFLALLAGGCSIAFAPIFVRLSDAGPVASAFWRTALAAPDPLGLGAARGPGATRISFGPLAGAGIFFACDLGVWHWSITYTSVANSTLLANLAPIFVTLAGWVLCRQQVTRTFLVGMVTAIAGMFILVGPNFAIGGTRLAGDALGALTAVFYAGYMLSIKRRGTRAPPPRGSWRGARRSPRSRCCPSPCCRRSRCCLRSRRAGWFSSRSRS